MRALQIPLWLGIIAAVQVYELRGGGFTSQTVEIIEVVKAKALTNKSAEHREKRSDRSEGRMEIESQTKDGVWMCMGSGNSGAPKVRDAADVEAELRLAEEAARKAAGTNYPGYKAPPETLEPVEITVGVDEETAAEMPAEVLDAIIANEIAGFEEEAARLEAEWLEQKADDQ